MRYNVNPLSAAGLLYRLTTDLNGFRLQPRLAKILVKRLRHQCNQQREHHPKRAG